ncbi:Uu.00g017510.m01.CDS01 [Anthostomella pinea]|uniref:Uu.00g017510.m01.CDS01 n=1 Tax=Anthostomella pinea TaxID=933095 RepID=A0AAI8VYY0_9PEZI|nr:Uu.00g017510.m01.CDS01 [Anthostomella pinea]
MAAPDTQPQDGNENGVQVTEVYDTMQGFIKATHWGKPYYSSFIHNNPSIQTQLLDHVSCSYVSTPGRSPTLLALKQHAQSLTALIQMIAPSQIGAEIDNENTKQGDHGFAREQAFDWLNNLQMHYNTEDKMHKLPLNALANLIEDNNDIEGPKWHCALEASDLKFVEEDPDQQFRPFHSHMTLLMHANECLERLDHEYSAMGGILAVIPLEAETVNEKAELEKAKKTLIGQWILFTQHLTGRMHELEINYANCLDLLANEAVVPMQHLSAHGPDGRSGREIVFPQDKFILANAGEDVQTFIHQMLDRQEAYDEKVDQRYGEQEVVGEGIWKDNEKARGIVKLDLSTRYYRLRNSGHGPLFVLPAFGDRPNTEYTRDLEGRPTVVTVPEPFMPTRTTEWDRQLHDNTDELQQLKIDNSNLQSKLANCEGMREIAQDEVDQLRAYRKSASRVSNSTSDSTAEHITNLEADVENLKKKLKDCMANGNSMTDELTAFRLSNQAKHDGKDSIASLAAEISNLKLKLQGTDMKVIDREMRIRQLNKELSNLKLRPADTSDISVLQNRVLELEASERSALAREQDAVRTQRSLEQNLRDAIKERDDLRNERDALRTTVNSNASGQTPQDLEAIIQERINLQKEKDAYFAVQTMVTGNASGQTLQAAGLPDDLPANYLPDAYEYRNAAKNLVIISAKVYDELRELNNKAALAEQQVDECHTQTSSLQLQLDNAKQQVTQLSTQLSQAQDALKNAQAQAPLIQSESDFLTRQQLANCREREKQLDAALQTAYTRLKKAEDDLKQAQNDLKKAQGSDDLAGRLHASEEEVKELEAKLRQAVEDLSLADQRLTEAQGDNDRARQMQDLRVAERKLKEQSRKSDAELKEAQDALKQEQDNLINCNAQVKTLESQAAQAPQDPAQTQALKALEEEKQQAEKSLKSCQAVVTTLQGRSMAAETEVARLQTQLQAAQEALEKAQKETTDELNKCKQQVESLKTQLETVKTKGQTKSVEAALKLKEEELEKLKSQAEQLKAAAQPGAKPPQTLPRSTLPVIQLPYDIGPRGTFIEKDLIVSKVAYHEALVQMAKMGREASDGIDRTIHFVSPLFNGPDKKLNKKDFGWMIEIQQDPVFKHPDVSSIMR